VTVRTLPDGKTIAEVDQPNNTTGGFSIQQHGDDLYVLPDEAKPLLADDRLDQRLFNVTDLIDMGYDDAHTTQIPLIATYPEAATHTTTAPSGTTLTHDLPAINGHALTTNKNDTRTLWSTLTAGPSQTRASGVTKLWLDGQVHADLADSVPQVGAPEAWNAGYNGDGSTVAVLDSGIDPTHPDLVDQIQDSVSFVPDEDTTDVNGHGTHVASTIAGTGAASDGDNTGVAPAADLIIGKVLNDGGIGYDSWVIAGMQWAAESGADVVNMSLGDSSRTDGLDPIALAVDTLSAQHDTLFVVAAGNDYGGLIGTPGTAESALTVSAVDKQDQLARFSSAGPLARTGALKPDLTAPGAAINAARSQHSTGDGMYHSLDGTSMATPHVAGAAAILTQQHPNWTNTQLKNALMSSTQALSDTYSAYQVGTGRLDVAAAVNRTVQATGSVFFGYFDWPHQPTDTPVTKSVTLTNTSTTPVTINLTTTGNKAFTLNDSTVTVPAEGQIDVPVTGDPTTADIGEHTDYLIGTDASTGETITRTALGLIKEDERYDLTIKLRDRNGEPTSGAVLIDQAGERFAESVTVDGEQTLRLAPGTYTLNTDLDVAGEQADSLGLALLVAPGIKLDKPTEVTLDASQARLLDTTTPQRTEDRRRTLTYAVDYPNADRFRFAYRIPIWYDDLYVLPTEKPAESAFTLGARWRKGEPVLSLRAFGLLPIDAVVQASSTITTGAQWLRPVYAGTGTPEDYANVDADGKIAVIKRSDDISAADRAAAAAAAGAELLLIVNDNPGILHEWVGDSPIPIASVHRDIGNILITLAKHGMPPLKVTQKEYPDTIYDLNQAWSERVPDQPLTYHPSHHDLARIDARYHAVQDTTGEGYRYDLTLIPAIGSPEREQYPGTRTEWVTPDTEWYETHAQGDWEDRAFTDTYAKGTTTRRDWFAPAVRPAFGRGYSVSNSRYQDTMLLNVQSWSPSGSQLEHAGNMQYGSVPTNMKLYQGDTLLHENTIGAYLPNKEVPAGTLPYRLVLDASRPAEEWGLSTRTHTEWDFISSTNEADRHAPEPLTLLQLDYELETDLRGDVEAGTHQDISITPKPQPGGSGTGTITAVELEVSYDDGTTWQPITLTPGDNNRHTATLKLPDQPDSFISVRAAAETDTGFAI
ncbi:S8 family serine peptidase, partial [Salinispora vitiensis]|uniref:S8 family serine peptidase n=1 Tax=Salinispora vitiensis TaxID=999544 RepID=UPI0004879444